MVIDLNSGWSLLYSPFNSSNCDFAFSNSSICLLILSLISLLTPAVAPAVVVENKLLLLLFSSSDLVKRLLVLFCLLIRACLFEKKLPNKPSSNC